MSYYNTQCYHESLENLTPADVFAGRKEEMLTRQEQIEQQTLLERHSVMATVLKLATSHHYFEA